MTTLSGASKSFNLSPGGIHNHEGHQILTSSGTQIEINLLAQHGEKVQEGHLKDRLSEMKELFRSKRQEKKDAQQAAIDAMSTRLNELLNAPEPTKEKKKELRKRKIAKLGTKIADAQAEIAKYNALDENDRTQVFEYLDKWRKQGESMATDVVTKFIDNHVMEQVILAVLNKHQANIHNAFTDFDGNPKPMGTTVAISDTIAQSDVGVGYELDAKMEVVPVTRALQGLQIHLVISGPYEYMVETAYLKPGGVT
ncbi:MAG: hypothetical protein ACPGWR_24720 [Ardenticatenaceae bacterium]